ncbi:hypothetical protein [Tautonia sociabilis]|uniref:TRASH domain-containing protein n=1 Tax=Tautonia sociabilis TaxID=2080755 RepID=A0A432MIR4_9BACT|nr:hypothetical protein [Tautonia sociabilis]RUL87046.1 hypothetical protein TsocGM_14740 [Tautonia sociabilis]
MDLSRVAASATFYHPNLPDKPWFSRPLRAAPSHPGHPAEALELAIDLSKVPAEGAKVAFRLEGLADSAEPTATFTVPFAFAKAAEIAVTKATEADRAAIGALKLCPVSGEELDSMGGPLKVSRGDQATFICCKGCLEPIQADPDKYLSGGVKPGAAAEHDHQHHE